MLPPSERNVPSTPEPSGLRRGRAPRVGGRSAVQARKRRAFAVAAMGFALPLATFLASSCSSPDPAALRFVERVPTPEAGAPETAAPGPAQPAATITAFTGAPTYVAPDGGGDSSDNENHGGDGNPAGQNCLDCHSVAGPGPHYLFGGTVWSDPDGGVPVPKAEVRITTPFGQELAKTYTNDDGNFWVLFQDGGIPAGSHAGVRNADNVQLMPDALKGSAEGSCQQSACHVIGAQGRIHLVLKDAGGT